MNRLSALIAVNNVAVQLATKRAGNQQSGRSASKPEEGVLLGWRSRRVGFLKLGCPHIFDELGIGASAHVRCCLCGGEMDQAPGDPRIWR
jgi:hypothetical protein